MKWLTIPHSHRWHAAHKTVEIGHLYQPVGWVVSTHRIRRNTVCYRKIDGLMTHPAVLWPRTGADKPIQLSDSLMKLPKRRIGLVDGLDESQVQAIEICIERGRPFGDEKWC